MKESYIILDISYTNKNQSIVDLRNLNPKLGFESKIFEIKSDLIQVEQPKYKPRTQNKQ